MSDSSFFGWFFRHSKLDFVFFREGFDPVKGEQNPVKVASPGRRRGIFGLKRLIFVMPLSASGPSLRNGGVSQVSGNCYEWFTYGLSGRPAFFDNGPRLPGRSARPCEASLC